MFSAIGAYFIGRKIVNFIVMASMMVGLVIMCLVAYAFVPAISEDSDASDSHTVVSVANEENNSKYSYSSSTNTMFVND